MTKLHFQRQFLGCATSALVKVCIFSGFKMCKSHKLQVSSSQIPLLVLKRIHSINCQDSSCCEGIYFYIYICIYIKGKVQFVLFCRATQGPCTAACGHSRFWDGKKPPHEQCHHFMADGSAFQRAAWNLLHGQV